MNQKTPKVFEILVDDSFTIEKATILLAMTGSRQNEESVKQFLSELGYACAVTEVSGTNDEIKKKIINAVVGASLNLKIIDKTAREIHALVHATLEACTAIKLDIPITESFLLKIAILKNSDWICVGIYGQKAMHVLTNQKTVGLGQMHL